MYHEPKEEIAMDWVIIEESVEGIILVVVSLFFLIFINRECTVFGKAPVLGKIVITRLTFFLFIALSAIMMAAGITTLGQIAY